jgi:high affinity Mn2+ porin
MKCITPARWRPAAALHHPFAVLAGLLLAGSLHAARAEEATPTSTENWSVHGQWTTVGQTHPGFDSPYEGANSMRSARESQETTDLTLYLGARLWHGAEIYANGEIDQGFGISNTLGAAGFPSGEAYKVGANKPYVRWPRLFLRQVFALSEETATVAPGANLLAGTIPWDNVTLTLGKFSVTDVFDTNAYAHDPRADFLNWSVIDAGAFDYPADAWGYTTGMAVEWTQAWWTLRGGVFNLSTVPNSKELGSGFEQFGAIAEFEIRHHAFGGDGKVKLLGFLNRGRMARYDDAVAFGRAQGVVPDVEPVRTYASRPGAALNIEQSLAADLGFFLRASMNDGSKEAFEFTEINRSLSLGLSMKGARWKRGDDTLGVAAVVNRLSSSAVRYFDAGGLGILIGDGRLPDPSSERIFETYYALRVAEPFTVSLDYQYLVNPAYNRDRGPVSLFAARLHAEF